MKFEPFQITSIQSPNADFYCERIAEYLSFRLGMEVEFENTIPWQEREKLLDQGSIQAGWICGLPYVQKVDRQPPLVRLLAAPVMAHPRYQDRPIYFSDVIVRNDSQYTDFSQLEGASWAYNEPNSQSGYNLTRYHLAVLGKYNGYFAKVVEAGSHLRALQMIVDGEINASAIDSTVLELELNARPELAGLIRVIATLGPSPIPPWVATNRMPSGLFESIRQVLLKMHLDPIGKQILSDGLVRKMVAVEDSDYDPIRRMKRLADKVSW